MTCGWHESKIWGKISLVDSSTHCLHMHMSSAHHLQTCMSSAHHLQTCMSSAPCEDDIHKSSTCHLHVVHTSSAWPVPRQKLAKSQINQTNFLVTWHLPLRLQRGKTYLLCSEDDMSSSRGADDMSSDRGVYDMSSGRGADDMSSSRGADELSPETTYQITLLTQNRQIKSKSKHISKAVSKTKLIQKQITKFPTKRYQ